jgi:hypothetical protein
MSLDSGSATINTNVKQAVEGLRSSFKTQMQALDEEMLTIPIDADPATIQTKRQERYNKMFNAFQDLLDILIETYTQEHISNIQKNGVVNTGAISGPGTIS